jgi:hypothetical protein
MRRTTSGSGRPDCQTVNGGQLEASSMAGDLPNDRRVLDRVVGGQQKRLAEDDR